MPAWSVRMRMMPYPGVAAGFTTLIIVTKHGSQRNLSKIGAWLPVVKELSQS
jgi:hypothetical protein